MHACIVFMLFFLLQGCSDEPEKLQASLNAKGEYIYRLHNEFFFSLPAPEPKLIEPYAWESYHGSLPKVTKEYFRCKGSPLNPVRTANVKEETVRYQDCSGSDKHSLPLKDGKEFIYPVLLDLLNYLQNKTGKRVVITCGHRCPEHNTYSDPTPQNRYSKHMIGAEAAFYVQGLEDKPEQIVNLIIRYYQEAPKYQAMKEYTEFKRYEKMEKTDVQTPPWYNKEIFIKLYKKKEGRDFDNRHPYPYLRVQVRYDWDRKEKVVFDWKQANKNYLRK
jgi:hypothetical protein